MNDFNLPDTGFNANQRGVVLVVSLVILLVMTLIGVFGMRTAILDNMMANNAQFQTEALNEAEVVVLAGENDIQAVTDDGVALDLNDNQTDRYYDATSTSGQDVDPSLHDWTSGDFHPATVTDGQYVIQYGGKEVIPGNPAGYGGSAGYSGSGSTTAGGFVYAFKVSARSESRRGALRIVQTVYVTANAP
jgi:Tfp pilus assembly protein PilX